VVRVTGLRRPGKKRLGEWPKGLLDRCKGRDGNGVGVMGAVETDGYVMPGYVVYVETPEDFVPLRGV